MGLKQPVRGLNSRDEFLVSFQGLVLRVLGLHKAVLNLGSQVVDTTYGTTNWLQAGDWADVMPTFQAHFWGLLSQKSR